MNKRPKSREETPKEGSDRARPYRTATICGRAAQKARVFELVQVQSGTGWPIGNTPEMANLIKQNQLLDECSEPSPSLIAVLVCQKSQLRDGQNNQKSTLKRAFAKAIRKLTSQYEWE